MVAQTKDMDKALKKSCQCLLNDSFKQQVSRLNDAGYLRSLVMSVSVGLHKKALEKGREEVNRAILSRKNVAVILYIHLSQDKEDCGKM